MENHRYTNSYRFRAHQQDQLPSVRTFTLKLRSNPVIKGIVCAPGSPHHGAIVVEEDVKCENYLYADFIIVRCGHALDEMQQWIYVGSYVGLDGNVDHIRVNQTARIVDSHQRVTVQVG